MKNSYYSNYKQINRNDIFYFKIETSLEDISFENDHPYLLAIGESRSSISFYFLAIKGKVLKTNAEDFQTAFDQLFKSHFVFHVEFEETLSTFYQFVQSFYYGMQTDVQFTPRMRELRSYLCQED